MITRFESGVAITDRIGIDDCNDEMLETFDKLLTAHGIEHAFMYTYADKQEEVEKQGHRYIITLLYQGCDEVKLMLLYTLWLTETRNANESLVRRYLHRYALRNRHEDKATLKRLDEIMNDQKA